jgi:diaminohydroxyphosphoribosylaminopyrimidine deaminase/5-amino-6-(5-phosphoribosylamino)uracil reductase
VVDSGLLERQAVEMNAGFFKRMRHGLPLVTVKVAASLDGKVALRNGVSKWITGEAARRDVQQLRARSSAVLTGIDTVLADDPLLTVRDPGIDMLGRQPLRVVCDTQLRIPASAKLFGAAGPVAVYTAASSTAIPGSAELRTVPVDASGSLDLHAVLKDLAARHCNEVLVEAGPKLSGRFVELGLADRLIVYLSPVLLGGDARSMLALPPIDVMTARKSLELIETRHVGQDLRLTWRVSGAQSAS